MESSLENTNYLRLFLKYGAKVDKETFLTFKQVVYKNPNNRMPQELKQEIYELLIHAMKNQEMGQIFGTLRKNTDIAKATEEVSMVKRLPDEITDKILRSAITDKHPMHLYDVALSPSSRKHSRRVRNLKRSSSKKTRSK